MEPTDEELLALFSSADGDSNYDGWRALWRAGYEQGAIDGAVEEAERH